MLAIYVLMYIHTEFHNIHVPLCNLYSFIYIHIYTIKSGYSIYMIFLMNVLYINIGYYIHLPWFSLPISVCGLRILDIIVNSRKNTNTVIAYNGKYCNGLPDLKKSEQNKLYPLNPRIAGGALGTFGGVHGGGSPVPNCCICLFLTLATLFPIHF